MRHGKKVNHLGRTSPHRKALLSNMATSLILHKRINTTLAKAKELRKYVEPLITRSKEVAGQTEEQAMHHRRVAFSYLQDKFAVTELFKTVGPKIGTREGGYTRILRTGMRHGDAAEMCLIELVDFNENMLKDTAKEQKAAAKKTRRGRKKATEAAKTEE